MIPKKLKIGGHLYRVEFKEMDDSGEVNKETNTIFIDGKLSESEQEATLVHEVMHVMNSEIDHVLLDSLSQQIYQVLKDYSEKNSKDFYKVV